MSEPIDREPADDRSDSWLEEIRRLIEEDVAEGVRRSARRAAFLASSKRAAIFLVDGARDELGKSPRVVLAGTYQVTSEIRSALERAAQPEGYIGARIAHPHRAGPRPWRVDRSTWSAALLRDAARGNAFGAICAEVSSGRAEAEVARALEELARELASILPWLDGQVSPDAEDSAAAARSWPAAPPEPDLPLAEAWGPRALRLAHARAASVAQARPIAWHPKVETREPRISMVGNFIGPASDNVPAQDREPLEAEPTFVVLYPPGRSVQCWDVGEAFARALSGHPAKFIILEPAVPQKSKEACSPGDLADAFAATSDAFWRKVSGNDQWSVFNEPGIACLDREGDNARVLWTPIRVEDRDGRTPRFETEQVKAFFERLMKGDSAEEAPAEAPWIAGAPRAVRTPRPLDVVLREIAEEAAQS